MARALCIILLGLAALAHVNALQEQELDSGPFDESGLAAQVKTLQKNITELWSYIYDLRNAMSQHLVHLRQHQMQIESTLHDMTHHHEDEHHHASATNHQESHGHMHEDDHGHGDSHEHKDGHSDDHSHDHHHEDDHSHQHHHHHEEHKDTSGTDHSHGHGDHEESHDHHHDHSEEQHHHHGDSHEKHDSKEQDQQKQEEVAEKVVVATVAQHHHHHHGNDPLDLLHLHRGHSHNNTRTAIPRMSDSDSYNYAICDVRPNTAIATDLQQDVRGQVALWQDKQGGPLGIHVRLSGFRMGGHGHHHQQHQQQHGQDDTEDQDITSTSSTGHKHGFHIHDSGDLSNSCQSTGPHYNPKGVNHGGPTATERHVGDLGNIECDDHGYTNIVFNDNVASLTGPYSIVGRAIVVHANSDDYGLNPDDPESLRTGNAGTRIACCVIQRVDRLPSRIYKSMKIAKQYKN